MEPGSTSMSFLFFDFSARLMTSYHRPYIYINQSQELIYENNNLNAEPVSGSLVTFSLTGAASTQALSELGHLTVK